jgi:hypothetical protein
VPFICPAENGFCPITDLHKSVNNEEDVLVTSDGRQIQIIKYVGPVEFHGRKCLLETFINNTDRKNAELAIKAANKKLNLLSKVTRNDILNDLFVLAGYLDFLRNRLSDHERKELMEKVE